jgi:uncharacterized small protein (DUF1192 family)
MPIEEDEAPRKRPGFVPAVLDGWSVADMDAYLEALEAEIARVRAAREARGSVRAAADALFRQP